MENQTTQPKRSIWQRERPASWFIVLLIILIFFSFITYVLSGKKENSSQIQQTQEQQVTKDQNQEIEQQQNERFEQDKEAIRSFYREIVVYDTKVANYFTTTREKISQTSDYLLYQALITAEQNMDQYSRGVELIEIPEIYNQDDQKQLKNALSLLTLTYEGRSGYFGYYAKALDETTNADILKKKNQAVALGEQAHEFEIEAIEKLVEILDKYDLTDEY